MDNASIKQWIPVIVIWAGALLFVYGNGKTIDQKRRIKENQEIYRQEERFVNDQSSNIPEILEKAKNLYQSVEAPRIGILSLEGEIHVLAASAGLENVEIKTSPSKNEGNNIPVTVMFTGSLKDAMEWLGSMQNDYPYVVVKQVDIGRNPLHKQIQFAILLNYRYRIIS